MGTIVYTLRNVVKTRSKGGASFTLRVPHLELRQGEFCSVVGPSGCGKSTLLDMLALVLAPTSAECFQLTLPGHHGQVAYDLPQLGEGATARIRRSNIGYVLQNGGLLSFLTVRENILLTAQISRRRPGAGELEELVRVLGLADQLEKKPQYLSGGQRQRVAVARALIHRPGIILADEPTAAVDYPTALDIRDELLDLAQRMGAAVIMVTHDRSLVDGVSDMQVNFTVQRVSAHEVEATASVGSRGGAA